MGIFLRQLDFEGRRVRMERRLYTVVALVVVSFMSWAMCAEQEQLWFDPRALVLVGHSNQTITDDRVGQAFKWASAQNTTDHWLYVLSPRDVGDSLRDDIRPMLDHFKRHTFNATLPIDNITVESLINIYENMLLYHPTLRWHVTVVISDYDKPWFTACAKRLTEQYQMPWSWKIIGTRHPTIDSDTLLDAISTM